MTTSLLKDAFAHHIWATDRLFEVCAALTRDQLVAETPGTYGPIIATMGHLVASDSWYLTFHRDEPAPTIDEQTSLAEMRIGHEEQRLRLDGAARRGARP